MILLLLCSQPYSFALSEHESFSSWKSLTFSDKPQSLNTGVFYQGVSSGTLYVILLSQAEFEMPAVLI